jgi:cyclic beta-1,2-glucan synthetase
VRNERDLPLVVQVLKAQELWRLKGLSADLVILNERGIDYRDEMQQQLETLAASGSWAAWKGRSGGVFLLRTDGMTEDDAMLLKAAARAVVSGLRGDLAAQLRIAPVEQAEPAAFSAPERGLTDPVRAPDPPVPPLRIANGFGGFGSDTGDYVVVLEGDRETPAPWANVIANPSFGTIVTTSGASWTWSANSRENRLTPFANDPVTDPTGEAFFIRDDATGEIWTATPGPMRRHARSGRWVVVHGAGFTRFSHAVGAIAQELTVCVDPTDPVKHALLEITNHGTRPRRLSVFAYAEWALGPPRRGEHLFTVTEADAAARAVLARNPWNQEFAGRVAFLSSSEPVASVRGDRREVIGRNRSRTSASTCRPAGAPASRSRSAKGPTEHTPPR